MGKRKEGMGKRKEGMGKRKEGMGKRKEGRGEEEGRRRGKSQQSTFSEIGKELNPSGSRVGTGHYLRWQRCLRRPRGS